MPLILIYGSLYGQFKKKPKVFFKLWALFAFFLALLIEGNIYLEANYEI